MLQNYCDENDIRCRQINLFSGLQANLLSEMKSESSDLDSSVLCSLTLQNRPSISYIAYFPLKCYICYTLYNFVLDSFKHPSYLTYLTQSNNEFTKDLHFLSIQELLADVFCRPVCAISALQVKRLMKIK